MAVYCMAYDILLYSRMEPQEAAGVNTARILYTPHSTLGCNVVMQCSNLRTLSEGLYHGNVSLQIQHPGMCLVLLNPCIAEYESV